MVALALAVTGPAHAQSANPLSAGAQHTYDIAMGYITAVAAKMPEEHYAFQPTPAVRTFAQLLVVDDAANGGGRLRWKSRCRGPGLWSD